MNIEIEGIATSHCEYRSWASGAVTVVSLDGSPGLPVEAYLRHGDRPEDFIAAASFAAGIRKGDTVVCTGAILRERHDHGTQAILFICESMVVKKPAEAG